MKWVLAIIIIGSFSGMLIGFTDWAWWLCICVSLIVTWCTLLVYMVINNYVVNSKKHLLKEIERHEKLEERLVEDVLSLIELYDYCLPNCSVAMPNGTNEKLRQSMVDLNEYMAHRKADK